MSWSAHGTEKANPENGFEDSIVLDEASEFLVDIIYGICSWHEGISSNLGGPIGKKNEKICALRLGGTSGFRQIRNSLHFISKVQPIGENFKIMQSEWNGSLAVKTTAKIRWHN